MTSAQFLAGSRSWVVGKRGRIGWFGGTGTNFFVDPDGTVGILLTQVEMDEHTWPLIEQFQSLHEPS